MCCAAPSKQDLVYVRIAQNARLQPGEMICNVSVETAPGQLSTLPTNQIYSFGEGGAAKPNPVADDAELTRGFLEEMTGVPYEGESSGSAQSTASPETFSPFEEG